MPDLLPKRILVVDDAATVRMYHNGILSEAGFIVDEAINGIEALEKSLSNPYDFYVVDINMPKLDGYGFLQQLRAQDIHQAPAVMISTEAEGKDIDSAYSAGANFYMRKPIKPDELLNVVRMLLGMPGEDA